MKYLTFFGLAALLGLFSACTKDPLKDLTLEESQVFITNYDKSVNFSQYQTFSILDSVLVIGNQGNGSSLTDIDIQFLTQVVDQMKALGYTYVSPQDNPDLGINVAQVRNSFLNVVSQPISPFLGNFWGGGFGYGYGYGYPAYFSYYQTRENYWYMEMIDFKNPDTANNQVKVVWNAEIRGNGLFEPDLLNSVIQQVFEQSTYLNKN
ncbi:DUF4136 domain-containing protein [Arundinibacter roseus]|uniref:DUF4136 domain-containing protein n=1 Tax=Arundinibacter roseus TaxID=2070510 RepID=A0A4R4KKF2_9BACT|nr:DUF4136 domain-containing protein [Arundinibacter roseus]TDB67081.1 DUF4136 domain-containing protein [Arundinibacter roseus]